MSEVFLEHESKRNFKGYKNRMGPDGLHLHDRDTGTNILLNEVVIPNNLWAKAPRQTSIALTNTCDLFCIHCYAPKNRAVLNFKLLKNWLLDLDANGCISVGFGGGEPTLYPKFIDLCEFVANKTHLALTMTTHGHRITPQILDAISSNVNFIRVSMDGVNSTYEAIRGRSFREFIEKTKLLSGIVPFGVNFVVNQKTLGDLTEAALLAEDMGASEFLLLPEMATGKGISIDPRTKRKMQEWINSYRGNIRLSISISHTDGIPICEPFEKEVGLSAYAHIDAEGRLKASSFDKEGILINGNDVVGAIDILKEQIEGINK